MEKDLIAENAATRIRIVGINSYDASAYNTLMCTGRDLPWLQDTIEVLAWGSWDARTDDVIICDDANGIVQVYNLIDHDLADQANADELVAILKQLAGE